MSKLNNPQSISLFKQRIMIYYNKVTRNKRLEVPVTGDVNTCSSIDQEK